MKFNISTNNFASGEWSPKMRGRTDAQQYRNSSETMENFIPQIQGGAFRRPGFSVVPLTSGQNTRIQDAYNTGGGASGGLSKIIPYPLSNGKFIQVIALPGIPSANWVVNGDGSNEYLGYVSTRADFARSATRIRYSQVGDILFMVDSLGTSRPVILYYQSGSVSMLTPQDFVISQKEHETVPYLDIQALGSSVTLTPSSTAGAITITASSAFFAPGHAGAYFKFSSGAVTGSARIVSYVSSTVVNASVIASLPVAGPYGLAASTSWEESAWSDYRGWPKSITAYEGRLIYGGTSSYPDTIWGTQLGSYFTLMERPFEQDSSFADYTSDNSTAFTLVPNTPEASNIRSLTSGKNLFIITDRSEINANSQNGFGKIDVKIESTSAFGGEAIAPVRVNNFVTYVQKGSRKIRDITFDFNTDQYKSSDLTFLADHLTLDPQNTTEGGLDPIAELAGYTNENTGIFVLTTRGQLRFLALDRDYQVNAWCKLKIGGEMPNYDYAHVLSIACMPKSSGLGDTLWALIVRDVNGTKTVTYESMATFEEDKFPDPLPNPSGLINGASFVDGRIDGTAVDFLVGDVWSGFDVYNGETLQVVVDGNKYVGDFLVTGGNITLDANTLLGFPDVPQTLYAGFGYTSTLKTMPIEIGNQVPDSPQGFIKRIDELIIKFYLTRGAKYGYDLTKMTDIDFKNPTQAMNANLELFTGTQRLKYPTDYSREVQVIVQQNKPYACNVLSLVCRGVTHD